MDLILISKEQLDNKQKMAENEFEIFELEEADGKRHSALHIPKTLPSQYNSESVMEIKDVLNIFMGDVSGSMCTYWLHVVDGWQNHIKDKLTGTTKIFVFGSKVSFLRVGTELKKEDNGGGGTDLTSALCTVRKEVDNSSESYVNIFFVTDGEHNSGDPTPETEIALMKPPDGKTVSVYLLGIGPHFPVNYSVDIRSHMHNGNANIPTLFWAKKSDDIVDEMIAIGDELSSGLVKLNLSVEGHILPGLDKTTLVHLGEWIYFEQSPEELPPISVRINEDTLKPIISSPKPITARHLLDGPFRQWNSVLIQQHRKKAHVPREVFDLMDSLFGYYSNIIDQSLPKGCDIKSRLIRKRMKSDQVAFQTLMNQSKSIIDVEGKFKNELELAETILKSTVTNRKYDTKNLKLKGHGQDEFEGDLKEFKKLYGDLKVEIQNLPPPTPEDCCRVLMTSTLGDLQDPDFGLILEENKFDLLKTFTMTGIPVYAPIRDASQFNPWTLVIKNILVNPFTIVCQQVLEHSAAIDIKSLGLEDKDVILQQDNELTRFNAVIPIVPAAAAEILKPLVLSKIYAMMSTFCILKNPHIIDFDAHLAALACAWMKTIRMFPQENRPQFAADRLFNIVATANLYMGRSSVSRYVGALTSCPKQALMTESIDEFDGKTLKCESLVKPCFFVHLNKDKFSLEERAVLLELMLFEFIGRCLSNYKVDEPEASPYTDFFCADLTDKEKRKIWLSGYCKEIIDSYQANEGGLLEKFFTLDDLVPSLKHFISKEVSLLTDKITSELKIAVDINQVKNLRSYAACGDVRWTSFKAWAHEMEIPEERIDEAFDASKVMAYIDASLQGRNSRDRLSKDLPKPDGILEVVIKRVLQENTRTLRSTILKEVKDYAVNYWLDEYKQVHSALVMPLRKQEVIEAAQSRGIQVTQDTFQKVYRYNEQLGILRNACQIPGCPHYLQPHNNFNQHLSVEREVENFPHCLHLVSREFCIQGLDAVFEEVLSGKHAGTQNRKLPPPPTLETLHPLHRELESLIIHYARNGPEDKDDA
ncbi:LOW QUALITY PROTEIN: uncharacterized protein LOC135220545 [Macrobrachium nipponense]|uniref:LOW QUALITY PROTEIN: uncharacterized protein LOC135220545 n=1 Tax=Macrobrachium nipponense TaxID=159736 RepID=UPI0030C86489